MVFSFLLLRLGLKNDHKNSLWLAFFIFLGGLYICPFMLGYGGWYSDNGYREFMFFMPFQQLFVIGPVFYFYTKRLLGHHPSFTKEEMLHLLPAVLYLIYSLVVFVVDKLILDSFYFYANGRDKDLDFWYQMAGLISMLFYLFLSLKHYSNYRKLSLEEASFADEIAYKWVMHFAFVFSLILILRVLFFVLNPEWGNFGSKYWYYLCFSILLFYISISGYTHTIISSVNVSVTRRLNLEPFQNKAEDNKAQVADINTSLAHWKDKIIELFDAKSLHKNASLTLTDLCNELGTNRSIISKVINQEFQMNFNDFVNKKRAEAVIEKLNSGDHINQTLLGIAMDCGFNSKTTFNRAFKKHIGITPKEYIDKNRL